MDLPSLSREWFEAMQLQGGMTGQSGRVASIEYSSPHELLPIRLEVVQDHNMETPGLPSSRSDLRSNRMLVEAEINQVASGCDTLLSSHKKAQGG
jgi:hypothetical protein